jgi:protein disulfide-isomerase
MVVEVWFDFLCPQSYLLQLSLEEAIKIYKTEPIELRYRSYEMLPGLKNNMEASLYDVIAKHLLIDRSEVESFLKQFPTIQDHKPYKVLDAHRMMHLAKQYDVSRQFITQIFHDYYTQNQDISNLEYLKEVGLKLGIKKEDIIKTLSSDQFSKPVESNRENAILKGIHRIPHMRINGKHPMYGMQTLNQLLKAFDHANHYERKFHLCEDDSCEIQK